MSADPEVGQVWRLVDFWRVMMRFGHGPFILTRRVCGTGVWEALDVSTSAIVTVVTSSTLYEREA